MADQYAYTAASSTLGIRFPSWALEGGQPAIAARLNDPAQWARIKREMIGLLAERGLRDLSFAVVASHAANPLLNGLTMKQVAAKLKGSGLGRCAARGRARADARRTAPRWSTTSCRTRTSSGSCGIRSSGFASDSSVLTMGRGVPHPRGYGNNARVLGEYVRKRHVIALEEAVRKMTSLPAGHFRLEPAGC